MDVSEVSKFQLEIEPLIKDMEKNITFMIYRDYTNYLKLKKVIDSNKFLDKNMTKLYQWAELLYTKHRYNTLSLETLNTIIDDAKVDLEKKEYLRNEVEELFILAESEYKLDLEGEVTQYIKQSGLLNWSKLITSSGGLDCFLETLSKDFSMNPDDVKNYIVLKTSDMFKSINDSASKSVYLDEGLDDLINHKIMEKSFGTGIPQKYTRLLSASTKGVQKGVNLLGSFSGKGKTTWLWILYILPILMHENSEGKMTEKIYILANEQEEDVFGLMYLFAVISTILNPLNKDKFSTISRDRIASNKTTQKDQDILNVAKQFILENFKGRIRFEYISGFNPEKIELTVARWSRLGYENFVFDTMKAERVDKYGDYIAMVTLLETLSKTYGIRSIVTIQLAINKLWRKYLDETCIANATGMITVVEHCLLFREVEYSELSTLDVKGFVKQPDGKYTYETLDPEKYIKPQQELMKGEKYMMFFLGKNRHGESNKVFLYRCNYDRMWMYECGEVVGLENDIYKEKRG